MAAYIISEVRSLDEALMEQYRQLASESIAAYGGTYLVRGAEIDALEGEASDGFRLVVVEFPSRADAQAWYQSPNIKRRCESASEAHWSDDSSWSTESDVART